MWCGYCAEFQWPAVTLWDSSRSFGERISVAKFMGSYPVTYLALTRGRCQGTSICPLYCDEQAGRERPGKSRLIYSYNLRQAMQVPRDTVLAESMARSRLFNWDLVRCASERVSRFSLVSWGNVLGQLNPGWVEGWVGRFLTTFFIEDYGGHRFRQSVLSD